MEGKLKDGVIHWLPESQRIDAEEEMLNNLWVKEYWSRGVGFGWFLSRWRVLWSRKRQKDREMASTAKEQARLNEKYANGRLAQELTNFGGTV